jgi:MATE family multidrug resistance protein
MVIKAGMFIIVIETIIVILYLIFLSRFVITFYTNDETTQEITAKYFLLLAILVPSDHIQSVFGSAVRALRKDKEGTTLMIVGYYIVAIPLAYILGFTANLGGSGLLLGVIGGSYCLLVGLALLLYSVDWEKQIDVIIQETETGKSIPELDKI